MIRTKQEPVCLLLLLLEKKFPPKAQIKVYMSISVDNTFNKYLLSS